MKQSIKLTEGQLHQIIKESVKKVLNELNGPSQKSYYKSIHDRTFDWDKETIIERLCKEIERRGYNEQGIINNQEIILSWMLGNNKLGFGIPTFVKIADDCGIDPIESNIIIGILNKMYGKVISHKPWR